LRPVRLRRGDTRCAAILDRGVEGHVDDRGVELVDRLAETVGGGAEALGGLIEGFSRRAGDRVRVILLGSQTRPRVCVEKPERDAAGLGEDLATVLRIGVVAIVGTLVDETLSSRVDHDAERVALAGQSIRQLAVAAARRRAGVPRDAVTGAPVAETRR